jgi:hypothetical protein
MAPPGPKELANRINALATREKKKQRLIPYAGFDRTLQRPENARSAKPHSKTPRKKKG